MGVGFLAAYSVDVGSLDAHFVDLGFLAANFVGVCFLAADFAGVGSWAADFWGEGILAADLVFGVCYPESACFPVYVPPRTPPLKRSEIHLFRVVAMPIPKTGWQICPN